MSHDHADYSHLSVLRQVRPGDEEIAMGEEERSYPPHHHHRQEEILWAELNIYKVALRRLFETSGFGILQGEDYLAFTKAKTFAAEVMRRYP